jgi:hypothetical protein
MTNNTKVGEIIIVETKYYKKSPFKIKIQVKNDNTEKEKTHTKEIAFTKNHQLILSNFHHRSIFCTFVVNRNK